MGKRRKHRGHFCWCCEWILPNERFSGGGHARHLCRGCARLGAAELAVRQQIRNVNRLLRHHTIIPRKLRTQFERYLAHPNERVRRYAEELAARSDEERALLRTMREEEEAAQEAYVRRLFVGAFGDLPLDEAFWGDAPDPVDAAEAWPLESERLEEGIDSDPDRP